jgi:hypothetical protein
MSGGVACNHVPAARLKSGMTNSPGTWFGRGARLRSWAAGLALLALSGLLLQPACDAWSARGGDHATRVVGEGSGRVAMPEARQRSDADECCVIEAMTDHASPLPSVAAWHDRSPGADAVSPAFNAAVILLLAAAFAYFTYRPPDRRASYHARSARLLL